MRQRGGRSVTRGIAGFTLVELLIVLTLLTALSAVLAPILLPSPGRQLQHAASEVITTLRETRRLAQRGQVRRRFFVDTELGRYGIVDSDRDRRLPDGTTAALTTAESLLLGEGAGGIDFFPDGSSTGGRLVLGLDGHARQIDIEWLTGRIRIGDYVE
ncbi:MAG: prepilin-type N-terminal cleavage/methylation domain-containing protein [Gammaproteobacteria bacterium]|nr:prepilin-type N-terminal cleavage/methylation domain-containing protein [Gammaproteobacteria bacterium]